MILLYIISMLSGFFLKIDHNKYGIGASLYFFFTIMLFIFPIIKFNSTKLKEIVLLKRNLFNIISYAFIILGVFTYIFFFKTAFFILTSSQSFLALRSNMVGGEVYFFVNIFYYIVTLYCQFYPIVIVFYFYSKIFMDNSKFFNRLLLFASTGYIINVLSGVGRDGFVLWSMSYIFAFIIFNNFMTEEMKKHEKRKLKYLIIIFLLIFIPITVSRFSLDGNRYSVIFSIIDYLGQQFSNFSQLYYSVSESLLSETSLKEIFPIFGKTEEIGNIDRYKYFLNLFDIDLYIFSTFIGSFIKYVSKSGLLFVSLLYSFIFSFIVKNKGYVSLGKVILITLLAQIPLHGLFYYNMAYIVCNFYMIGVLILSIIFWRAKNI